MASCEDYIKWFEEKDNRNWLKISVGLIITKRGLAPFVENTVETWKNGQVPPGINCSACSTAEIVPCYPKNKICKRGVCKLHEFVTYRPCPNKVCDRLRQSIINQHRLVGPSWRNTNARDWCSNAWEVAKAFVTPDGYDTISTSDDTDLNSIVSVLMNCLLFENYIPDLAHTVNVCTKVCDIGRKLRHTSKLEVTDDELKQWFGDMRALFNIPQHLAANSNAQSTLDVLNKLEHDQLHIERTDVLDAIIDVVTSLKRLNSEALIDNISKLQEIQQDIETQVEEHKRNVGDLIDEKKVEGTQHASTLQPIIDNKVDAYQQSFNEFKKELKKILLKHHITTTSTLPMGPFFPNGASRIEDFYVPPMLSEVFTQTTCDNKNPLETKKQPITSLEPLLTMNDTKKQFTIITANAGVGKTSFCHFLAVLWCASQTNERDVLKHFGKRYNLSFDVLEDIKYLFYIDMTTIPSEERNSVEEILYMHLKDELGYSEDDKQLFEKLFTQERGLVILDGLDETAISKLQPPIANRTYSVVLTCRPWKLADMEIPRHTYLHFSVDVLDAESVKELLRHANIRLNAHYGTTFKVEDFFAAVESQKLQSFTSNTLMGLQLYCVWHGRCIDDETPQKSNTKLTLGKTRSLIYADVLEMMFDIGQKRYKESLPRAQLQAPNERRLPTCFERCNTCKANSDTIYETGKIAFQMLIDLKCCFDQDTMNLLKENKLLQASGLITAIKSHKCSIKNTMYRFLHKTYQEFFAAVYLSSLKFESEDWMAYESHFESTFTPEIMLFLCVMNYEQGQRCAEMFGDIDRTFYGKSTFYFEKLIEYQSTVLQSYNECVNNGVSEPKLALRHSYIDNELMSDDHYLLNSNAKTTETYAMMRYGVCATNMNSKETMEERNITSLKTYYSNLQVFPKTSLTTLELIWLDNFEIRTDEIDLVYCENLKVLILQNIRLRRVAIAPAQLEQLVVSTREDLWKKIPPMEVTFAHGEQFSNRLRELSLVHIFLNGRLDISQCDKLQKLELDTMSFRATYHLDVSSFTDLTQITVKDIRLWQLTIGPAQLELFCVSTSEYMMETIPAMELSFQHGEQFSSKLRELWLDNISLDRQLDISQCAKLQTLTLDTLSFPDDYHLDISSFTDLTRITLNDISLMQLTIAPAQLELFCVSTSEYMMETIPAIELSFQHGKQFSSKLRELSLDNITLNGHLDISQCDKLQTLWLNTLSFPVDYHLNVLSFTHLTEIILRNICLKQMTIAPAQLETFWLVTDEDLREKIPPIEVTFAHGEQYTNKLKELSMDNIVLNGYLDISQCDKLQKLRLYDVSFPGEYHLDISSFTDLTRIKLRNVRLWHITIAPAQLRQFWVYTNTNLLDKIPAMKVTFDDGVQFTNKLLELGLGNIVLNGQLDISQCDQLQTLQLVTISFPDDYHLDVSSFTDLTEIILRNICLKQMTIAPAQLETFRVVTDEDLREKIPPIEVTFAHGEQYTNKLKELSMDNIVLNGYLDISQCDKLQKLRLYNVSFPDEYHLDISSFTDLTRIKLRNIRLCHITIAPAQLERFWVYTNTNLLDKIPAMRVTFEKGEQFTNKLLELSLRNIVLNGLLDISQCDKLQRLVLNALSFPDDYHLDVSSYTDLTDIELLDIRLKHLTIAPLKLECCLVFTSEDLREKIPPMEVTLAHGKQYNNTLLELFLGNIILNDRLDISSYDKLHTLQLESLSFPDDYHLDLSSYTDLTEIALLDIRLKKLTIAPFKLELFGVSTSENLWDEISPMEVALAQGEQYSNTLLELILDNIILDGSLDISQCNKLQNLKLDKLSFPDEYHLDMSSFTDLTEITLQNIRIQHLTIDPSKLEQFSVSTSEDLLETIPPIKVTFAQEERFSNKLRELILDNIVLNGNLDISQCCKLKTLRLATLTFPEDYHLDLTSYADLTVISFRNVHLRHVTISPAKFEIFRALNVEHMRGNIQPMEVTILGGAKFTHKLKKLGLVNIILDEPIDLSQCSNITEIKLSEAILSDAKSVPEVMQRMKMYRSKGCVIYEQVHSKQI
ncbi:uncharacterized protein LOC128205861 [Mya arenaria]|uniref:uncharacterized protein LOC128205861 n=1 Tax=Mya arenaria TaxID=6604 RepID=UPI0022E7A51A|nr:uncharacterized protein LOC128205861 [Mya arenaria]XP_052763835.1 uncharacterized protein LOC128205861 [Mya arenaria]